MLFHSLGSEEVMLNYLNQVVLILVFRNVIHSSYLDA